MPDEDNSATTRFLQAFVRLDRRWIFLSVGIVCILFMLVKLGLPMKVSNQAQGVFDAVTGLKPGSRVHLSIDYGPGSEAELYPQHVAILRQLFQQDCKVICSTLWADGPVMIDRGFRKVLGDLEKEGIKKTAGVDYVNLGYKAGDRVAIAKIGSSFKDTFPADSEGRRTADLPIMQGWDNYSGISLLMTIAVGDPGAAEWIQQVQSRYKVPMVAGVTAVLVPQLYSYYQSGNLRGFLGGLAGAAEYEVLVNRPAAATQGMNVQSIVHLLIVAFVIMGNVAHFMLRSRGVRVR